MKLLDTGHEILQDLYKTQTISAKDLESEIHVGQLTDRDKFKAAKQILIGLAVLYVFTVTAYMIRPQNGDKLLDIITITFPPIATLILAAYFRDKQT